MSATPLPILPDPRLLSGAARLALRYGGTFAPETVQQLLADSYQRLAETAAVRTHLVVLAERLADERLAALAHSRAVPGGIPRVLFVCTGNAGRSQLAAALLAHAAKGRLQVSSAGTRPAGVLDDFVTEVLDEVGADLPVEGFPKPLTEEVVAAADIVVTMGCGDACPIPAGRRYMDWPVPDPHGASLDTVRQIRDEIAHRVTDLVAELAPATS
ncbi:three-helix bundle dimerization domain-containing protein [Streptacidiphilus sp. P02-A3a]|uniref:arsenate reductase/protein-tyrosine-phosphatase family protein n=1 Tax=Streptacidiphilus sp. P02-A3a TaxID=2704468 RepID=UPI0015FCD039|nr:arsenate reductase ArsC [Streptacidiphilus sp. P02-A3a]QMU67091.1 arsenate reductase ArsC [Streptacidiphilus sp. P02-A3a]